jgi:hypothetical protein
MYRSTCLEIMVSRLCQELETEKQKMTIVIKWKNFKKFKCKSLLKKCVHYFKRNSFEITVKNPTL